MAVRRDQGIGQRSGVGLGLVVIGIGRGGRVPVLDPRTGGVQPQQVQLAQPLRLGGGLDLRVRLGLGAGGEDEGGEPGGGEADRVLHGPVLAPPEPLVVRQASPRQL